MKAITKDFLENQQQFHLGFLPTEQANPLSRTLAADFLRSPLDGVKTLQRCDREIIPAARRVFASPEYAALAAEIPSARRIIFSGCGATGRLAILLETMMRESGKKNTASIMTGGDYALVKAVENFEDHAEFGAQQTRELGVGHGDLFIAITEGGETSSVLGSLMEAAQRGARCFLAFNNPAELLRERLERCRRAIDDPRITVLDLSCGPMALAGSTRMQATTIELLIIGSALFGGNTEEFEKLLTTLESAAPALADYATFEASIYKVGGKITYFAKDFLLDIFTDTTERSPTFSLPPFAAFDDISAPQSWAFVKNPFCSTPEAWRGILHRDFRCFENPLRDISAAAIMKFPIGREHLDLRLGENSAAVFFMTEPIAEIAERFSTVRKLEVPRFGNALLDHLSVKLYLNTISTGTMVLLGRVAGNWMSHVNCTNKKLIDRGARLIADLAQVPYAEALDALFTVLEKPSGGSPVQDALRILAAEK